MGEVRVRQQEYDELVVAVRSLQSRIDEGSNHASRGSLDKVPHLGLAASLHTMRELEQLQQQQAEQGRRQQRQERQQILMKEALQQCQQHLDEVLASTELSRHLSNPDQDPAVSPIMLRDLESRINALSGDVSTQTSRITRLEREPFSYQAKRLQEESERVMSAVYLVRGKEEELLRLMRDQQQQLESLHQQQLKMQEQLQNKTASYGHAPDRNRLDEVEFHLRGLGEELRKFQQEHRSSHQSQDGHLCSSSNVMALADAPELLKELREERGYVAEMLDNVKQEKIEVITAMHIFVRDKEDAMQELDSFRRNVREELASCSSVLEPSCSLQQIRAQGQPLPQPCLQQPVRMLARDDLAVGRTSSPTRSVSRWKEVGPVTQDLASLDGIMPPGAEQTHHSARASVVSPWHSVTSDPQGVPLAAGMHSSSRSLRRSGAHDCHATPAGSQLYLTCQVGGLQHSQQNAHGGSAPAPAGSQGQASVATGQLRLVTSPTISPLMQPRTMVREPSRASQGCAAALHSSSVRRFASTGSSTTLQK